MLRLLWVTFLLGMISNSTFAQTAIRYNLNVSNGTYASISTTGTSRSAVAADDAGANITALTPGFTVNGTTYVNARMLSNGFLALYTTTAPGSGQNTNYTPLSANVNNGAVVFAPFGIDLINTTGTAAYSQTIAGEHIFEWKNFARYDANTGLPANDVLNFQIRLNTLTGEVKFVYGATTVGALTDAPQVGWKTAGTTAGNWATDINNLFLNVTGSPTTCDWSNVVTANANTSTVYFNNNNPSIKPNSGLTYTWTPQNTVSPVRTFAAVTGITSDGATISWTAPSGATMYNVQYRVAGTSCTWTNWSGNPVLTNTLTMTGLASNTKYHIRVQAADAINTTIYSHTPTTAGGTGTNGNNATGTFTTLQLACSGTPNPGNTLINNSSPCPGTTVNFSLQNAATLGSGATYQWYNNAGPVAGATNLTYSQVINAPDDVYADVTCSGVTASSNLVSVSPAGFINCYCTPATTNGCTSGDHITNVTFTSFINPINNNTGVCLNASYSNYTTTVATAGVTQGDNVPVSVSVNDGGTEYAGAWIDYNHSGTFDASEFIPLTDADGIAPWVFTTTATIPFTATTGMTRMRFRSSFNQAIAATSACDTYSYGETEDYFVDISLSSACTGTPNPGNTVAASTGVCPNVPFTLSLQNPTTGTGVTYQWYNNSGAITGATNATYTTSLTSPDVFYATVTCSGATGTSTPVSITINGISSCYCAAGAIEIGCTTGDEYIGNVTLNTINNTSTCPASGQYSDFTSISTTLNQNQVYTASVLVPNWFLGDQVSMWIDFNLDGQLDDLTEQFVLLGGVSGTVPFTGLITVPLNAQPGPTRLRVRAAYTGTVSSCGIPDFGEVEDYTVVINPVSLNSTLNLTCFIEGFWDGTSQMLPVLANQGEPTTPGDCDSIDVELRDQNSFTVSYSTRTVLKQDGTATCVFASSVTPGNYYVAVKHRNAIETWSSNPVAMGLSGSYDFSTSATQAYGGNQIQISTSPARFAFYSGDVVKDAGESTDLLDLSALETDINNFVFGYAATDVNGDGNVDILDSPILESNISNFIFSSHP